MGLIFEGTVGEAAVAARLAMLQLGHLILGRGNYLRGIGGQDILRTIVVKETVQAREPEGQPPTILCVTEDPEDLRHLLARTMIGGATNGSGSSRG
jgi:hypothetical protein